MQGPRQVNLALGHGPAYGENGIMALRENQIGLEIDYLERPSTNPSTELFPRAPGNCFLAD
jgi:hypothetical protein